MRETVKSAMICWSIDSEDWKSRDPDKIYEQIVGKVQDGDIILMHDIHTCTLEAMKAVIPALIEDGFQLVTVSDLFEMKGITPEAGKVYRYVR
jgi:peptidoglycan-N-acetylglucosamine deacetylase